MPLPKRISLISGWKRIPIGHFNMLPLVFLLGIIPLHLQAQESIIVDIGCVIKNVIDHPVSINVNYLMDEHNYLFPTHSTEQSLNKMHVGYLRYPGGEKSDNYFWSVPPFQSVNPHFAIRGDCNWPANDFNWSIDFNTPKEYILDFDEFMTLCQKVNAKPLIVVAGDPQHYNDPGCTYYPTLTDVTNVAKEWVRYANISKEMGIKYWMVGNESWHSAAYDNGISSTKYRDDFKVIASAMKAVDPTIKIIANSKPGFYTKVLLQDSVARSLIDYIGISNYAVKNWGNGYHHYRGSTPNFLAGIDDVADDIEQYAPNSGIRVIVTEFSPIDWSGSWSNDKNDLGHALVAFQMLGDQLESRHVDNAFFWNTRWVNETYEMYNAIDFDGNHNPTGMAISIWGRFMLDKLISASETNKVRAFASKTDAQDMINVFLLNKDTSTKAVDLTINTFLDTLQGNVEIKVFEMTGNNPEDEDPTYLQINKPLIFNGNQISLDLSPISVTVLNLRINNVAAVPNSCPANLITENSGFEAESLSNWKTNGIVSLNSDAYSGLNALKIRGFQSGVEKSMAISSGDTCLVNAFIKGLDGNPAGTFEIQFCDENGNELYEERTPFQLEEHYSSFQFQAIAPENSHSAVFRFFTNANAGSMILDDICFMIENQENTTAIEPNQESKLVVFPNPTSGNLNLKLYPDHSFEKLEIYDLSGALLLNKSLNISNLRTVVDLSQLPSGTYLLKVKGEKEEAHLIRKF